MTRIFDKDFGSFKNFTISPVQQLMPNPDMALLSLPNTDGRSYDSRAYEAPIDHAVRLQRWAPELLYRGASRLAVSPPYSLEGVA